MPEKGNYPGGVTFEPVVNPVFRDALIKRLAEVHSQATEEKLFFRREDLLDRLPGDRRRIARRAPRQPLGEIPGID